FIEFIEAKSLEPKFIRVDKIIVLGIGEDTNNTAIILATDRCYEVKGSLRTVKTEVEDKLFELFVKNQ
ncbi:unnamed protein product, partial [marine sediment metagenome]